MKTEEKVDSWLARLDWIAALPPGKARSAAYAAASRYWIAREPEKVQGMLGEITDPLLRGQLVSIMAGYHTSISLEDGLRYVTTLPEGERENARKSLVLTWAKKDPEAAATHLLSEQEGNTWLSLVVIAQDWAALDAEAAVSFAMNHAQTPAGHSMLGSAMKKWVQDDPLSASSWLSQQPAGEVRDQAVAAFVAGAARTQPEGALGWAASIADEGLKRQTMQRAINTWANLDREETMAWLESAPIAPTLRQDLMVPLRSGSSRNPMDGFSHSSIETNSGRTLRF